MSDTSETMIYWPDSDVKIPLSKALELLTDEAIDGGIESTQTVIDLCDALRYLEAIVKRLPVTADGSPVVLGMNLYLPRNVVAMADGIIKCGFISMSYQSDEGFSGVVRDADGEEYEDVKPWQCYSTAAAARAAIAAKEKHNGA